MLKCPRLRIAAPRISTFAPLFLGLVSGLWLAGCTVNQAPRFKYGPEGEKIEFKRYEKHLAMDYIYHQSPVAFQRTEALPLGPTLSDKQQEILKAKGKPDYVRNDYLSDSNEIVTDWVYFEKNIIYQFVEGEMVYQGPVSDMDKTLIRRGRPSRVETHETQTGHRADFLAYANPFTNVVDEYVFSNGRLAGAQIQ